MNQAPDPFEFVRTLWSQMGIPGFAPGSVMAGAMPSFAPEDLEKRIGELKQIRQWLEINLNMLNLQVNGLEMQLATLRGLKSAPGADFAAQAAAAMRGATEPSQGAGGAGFGLFPFGMPAAATAAPQPPAPPPAAQPAPKKRSRTARPAAKPGAEVAWPDPTGWMQSLTSELARNMKAMAAKPADGGAAPATKPARRRKPPAAPRD